MEAYSPSVLCAQVLSNTRRGQLRQLDEGLVIRLLVVVVKRGAESGIVWSGPGSGFPLPTRPLPAPRSRLPVLQCQLDPSVVNAAVHAELRDAPAKAEASHPVTGARATREVRVQLVSIGKRIEQVARTHREPNATRHLVRDVEIDQRPGAERFVVVLVRGTIESCRSNWPAS